MLTYLGYGALTLLIAVLGVVALASRKPDTFHTARSRTIAAPPEQIFPLINDLRQMNTWNPFALRDPKSTGSYSTPSDGRGAYHDFAGPKSGSGRIAITASSPPSKIVMRLAMTKPMNADNDVTFTLDRTGDGATNVTWAMSGAQPLIGKCLGLFIDCDRMVAKEFEAGLENLKANVEGNRQVTGGTDKKVTT